MKKWLSGILLLLTSHTASALQLEIMTPVGNYMDFMRQEVLPEFKKRHPNVRVSLTNDENLDTRIAAGDLPDVYAGVFGYQPARYAKMGRLAYFDEFEGYDELVERIDPQFMRQNFGRTYYIPWNATTQLMIYNKELFREAGLNPDQPPRTWDEFLYAAEKISQLPPRADGSPVYGTVFWNEVLSTGSWYWGMLAQMYYNFNDGQYQLLNRFGTTPVFDRPDANMDQFLETIAKAQQFAPMTMEKSFFSRTIGMWPQFGFGWKANFTEAAERPMSIGKDIGVAPLPTRNLGDVSYSTLDGRALMIFKSDDEIEQLGWEFVQLLMEDEMNHKANIALAQLPVLHSLKEHEYYQRDDVKPFVDQLQNSLMSEPFAQVSDVANVVLDEYSKVVLKQSVSGEQAVIDAGDKSRKILRR
ncbi:ABC transporter [Vibrio ishigakensis]|uniref:ABC transporter n=1 Tax=Vibrio ishigakensis TaxID=1481914 RepID=A0A0B8P0V0_9VIBR|nr:extracellular solute-binding protein [Vibrio ishigakensis]GAM56609.1 ABC transporter [Vibrio ishigakensis]